MASQNPVDPAMPLWHRVDQQDRDLIEPYCDRTPVPIGAIADALGIEVISLTLPPHISGLIKQVAAQPDRYQIQINNTDAPVRQRFTAAHEVAHYLLHRSSIGFDGVTDSILFRSKLSNRVETEANQLAAAILLPWNKVITWHQQRFSCPPQAAHIEATATEFKVSALAVGFRFGI